MGHMIDGRFHLVTCGSKSLTPTQQRYYTIELECIAVHLAVSKCSLYLKGCESFTVTTNHRPLEGVPGKSHHIADALSRAPWFAEPEEEEELSIDTARTCLTQVVEKNPELRVILEGFDSDYTQFRRDIVEDTVCEHLFPSNEISSRTIKC